MFDVSHMQVVDLIGNQVQDFLSYLIANDINKIGRNQAIDSAMLKEDGGIIDDLISYYIDDHHYRLVVNAGCADKDIAWIKKQAENFSVTVQTDQPLAILAVQGPKTLAPMIDFLNHYDSSKIVEVQNLKPFHFSFDSNLMIAKTGYTGEDGFECIVSFDLANQLWDSLIQSGVSACGLASRDSLRLEAGFPLYGNDLDEHHHPLISGLAWCTSLNTDRDFIGKQAVLNFKNQGIDQKLAGIILKDKGMIRNHQLIQTKFGEARVTSGGFSPTLKQSIALARIPKDASGECEIEIRGKLLKAEITDPAFVKNGKILI